MFRFFRKIRETLLSQGKTAKYLKYAIGEVFLVVIGILLALWINNLNNKRLNKITERQILENIKNDLSKQLKFINQNHESLSNQLLIIENINTEYQEKKSLATIDSIYHKLRPLLNTKSTPMDNPAFTQIISTGEIDFISDKNLKENLVLYFNLMAVNKENIDFDQGHVYYPNVHDKLVSLIPVARADGTFFQTDELIELRTLQIKNPEVEFEILNAIAIAEDYIMDEMSSTPALKRFTTTLIDWIDKKLE